jgi:hypothetical protein
MKWLRRLVCYMFGHQRDIEDLGGVEFEVCQRCDWVGRYGEYEIEYISPCNGNSE